MILILRNLEAPNVILAKKENKLLQKSSCNGFLGQ